MIPLSVFEIMSKVVIVGFIAVVVLFIIMTFRILNYTETDKHGRKYRRQLFYPGRICPGCGLRVLTKIPTCPSCYRDFSKDSENSKVQYRDL